MDDGKLRIVMDVNTLKKVLGIPDAIEISMVAQSSDQHVADIVEIHLRGPGLLPLPRATVPQILFIREPRDRPITCDTFLIDYLRTQFTDIPSNDLSTGEPEERTRAIELHESQP